MWSCTERNARSCSMTEGGPDPQITYVSLTSEPSSNADGVAAHAQVIASPSRKTTAARQHPRPDGTR